MFSDIDKYRGNNGATRLSVLEFYFDRTNKFQNNTPYTFKFSNINPLYIFIISLYFCCTSAGAT